MAMGRSLAGRLRRRNRSAERALRAAGTLCRRPRRAAVPAGVVDRRDRARIARRRHRRSMGMAAMAGVRGGPRARCSRPRGRAGVCPGQRRGCLAGAGPRAPRTRSPAPRGPSGAGRLRAAARPRRACALVAAARRNPFAFLRRRSSAARSREARGQGTFTPAERTAALGPGRDRRADARRRATAHRMGLMASTPVPGTPREAFAHWWQVRSHAERRILAALAALVVVAILWLAVWQPIVRDADRLAQRAAADRAALAEARRAADEIAGLARAAPAATTTDPRVAFDGVLAARNLKGSATQVERLDNDRLRVTFDSIGFDALAGVLDALQREAKLRAVDVVATARVEPGLVRADVTLTR